MKGTLGRDQYVRMLKRGLLAGAGLLTATRFGVFGYRDVWIDEYVYEDNLNTKRQTNSSSNKKVKQYPLAFSFGLFDVLAVYRGSFSTDADAGLMVSFRPFRPYCFSDGREFDERTAFDQHIDFPLNCSVRYGIRVNSLGLLVSAIGSLVDDPEPLSDQVFNILLNANTEPMSMLTYAGKKIPLEIILNSSELKKIDGIDLARFER